MGRDRPNEVGEHTPVDESIVPFELEVTAEQVSDLQERLARTRWPDQLAGLAPWEHGTDLAYLQELCATWATYDWRAFEQRVNRFPQFRTSIDGQPVHFRHVRSPEPGARPLIISHGWPGTFLEFQEVVAPLTDPVAHGGRAEDAFHVVTPSLPGYGFSGPTGEPGWDPARIARAFATLMARLGYDRYFAQGGDWGSSVTMHLADEAPEQVAAIHVSLLVPGPPKGVADPTAGLAPEELAALGATQRFGLVESGYQALQSTKPQTAAYGLTDSPSGLAGWIVEKFRTWSDNGGDVESTLTREQLLDEISVYWLTGTIGSSMRLYSEALHPDRRSAPPIPTVPLGHSAFPGEIYRMPRSWAQSQFPTLTSWRAVERGGHFAALEVPDLFVREVRSFFADQQL
jgi:pimeloyl-ACP methyl ester carboxylesterase